MNYKIILTLLLVMIILIGPSGAYIDNYVVLDTFNDGQPSHIIYPKVLSDPRPDPLWTCPETEIKVITVGEVVSAVPIEEYKEFRPSPPCNIDRPVIYTERVELWLNPYGQITKSRYLDNYLWSDRLIKKHLYENLSEVLTSSDWTSYYIDDNNTIVNYREKPIIPSNHSIDHIVIYPEGYTEDQARSELNLTREEFIHKSNKGIIRGAAYNHSYEAQEDRLNKLKSEIDNKGGRQDLSDLKTQVEENTTFIDRIFDWILEHVGIDLRL